MFTGVGKQAISTSHRRDIEGLRAIAVTLVLLYHLGVPGFDGGYVGVDVFFVVSGFLITSTLLSDTERRGRLSLSNFYARRARRLLPISAVVLVATAIASAIILEPGRMHNVGIDTLAAGLFSSNWVFAGRATDYLQSAAAPSPLQHYWSLSLEEQFYVVWPLLLMFGSLIDRRLRKAWTVPVTIALITIGSFVASVLLTSSEPGTSYFGLHTRAWELGLGALLAVASRRMDFSKVRLAAPIGIMAIAAIIFSGATYAAPIDFPGWVAALPVVATGALIVVGRREENITARALGNPVFHFIGARSYSLYLWHWPVIILFEAKVSGSLSVAQKLLAVLISLALTEIGYRLVENPVRYSSTLSRSRLRTFAVGVVAIVIVSASGVALSHYEKQISSGYVASSEDVYSKDSSLDTKLQELRTAMDQAVLPHPLPDNLEPSLYDLATVLFSTSLGDCFVQDHTSRIPTCEFGDPNGTTRMALFGDSHLAQWFDTLNSIAKTEHIKLRVYLHAGCSITGTLTYSWLTDVNEPWCPLWAGGALRDIENQKFDYVLMTNKSFLRDANTKKEIAAHKWAEGMRAIISRVKQSGAKPILFGDNPLFGDDLMQCLVNNRSDVSACYTARATSTRPELENLGRRLMAESAGLFINVADLICTESICPAILGNRMLYRDISHLTVQGTEVLKPIVGTMIKDFIDRTS